MASRLAHDNNSLRLLLMPALAVGLAVGCVPAKGGGSSGGSTGSGNGGNSGQSGGSQSSGGSTSASGGNNNASGGNSNRSGGNNNPSGGNNNPSGGATTSSGGNNNPSGGTTTSSGGNNNPSGGTATSSGGSSSPSGGSTGSTGGSTTSTGNPPGWWKTADWKVSSVDWHGCVWTGVDSTVSNSTTSITPQDFISGTPPEGGPYEVSGTVFNDYNAVAMIGFNLNESVTGSATQCKYNKAAATADGPPVATVPGSATGIAVSWSAKIAPVTSFRIQIQGVKGATDATDRWCATISDASGPSFVKFSDFYPSCWNVGTSNSPGTAYAGQPIDAVVFLVPGTTTAKAPFDFTISGFAPGTSKSDAPGGAVACGTTTGSVGTTSLLSDATAATAASTQRAAVTGTDCKKYIINNNNWGNESGSYQSLSYTGNTFTDVVTSGSGGGSNVVSFPSIYIGGNGQITGGTTSTWSDSGLPIQISAIKSAKSTFKWSGGNGGNYNAAYDIWFAKSKPTEGGYNDAVSGFIMIWVFKPGSSQPIGSSGNTRSATIGGQSYTVWRGPRAGTATGTDGAGRPVISYVANSTNNNFSADLKAFFDDAVTNGSADMSAGGGITQAFSSSWYLTDVFAGFEIWNGSDAKGLQDTFTCVIQ